MITHPFVGWSDTGLQLARRRAAERLQDSERRISSVRGNGQFCFGCVAGDCDGELAEARAYLAACDGEIARRAGIVL